MAAHSARCWTHWPWPGACIPGQRNSLDALCKRYAVDNAGREYHGALLDAQLLADVYLGMTGGQAALLLDQDPGGEAACDQSERPAVVRAGLNLKRDSRPRRRNSPEHERYLCPDRQAERRQDLWRKLGSPPG